MRRYSVVALLAVSLLISRTGRPVGGIWPIPGSRAYCSGCLAPGLRLVGHTTGVHTGASGPILGARRFRSRTRLREGDTPDRGGRWTKTGKQRRNIRATPDRIEAIGARRDTGSGPGE